MSLLEDQNWLWRKMGTLSNLGPVPNSDFPQCGPVSLTGADDMCLQKSCYCFCVNMHGYPDDANLVNYSMLCTCEWRGVCVCVTAQ